MFGWSLHSLENGVRACAISKTWDAFIQRGRFLQAGLGLQPVCTTHDQRTCMVVCDDISDSGLCEDQFGSPGIEPMRYRGTFATMSKLGVAFAASCRAVAEDSTSCLSAIRGPRAPHYRLPQSADTSCFTFRLRFKIGRGRRQAKIYATRFLPLNLSLRLLSSFRVRQWKSS